MQIQLQSPTKLFYQYGNYFQIEVNNFFFDFHSLSVKLSVNLLTTDLPTD